MDTHEAAGASTPTARTIGVLGASGGIGTSCLAAGVATRAARHGLRVACADAWPGSGGIDVFFDREARPAARWPDLADARGRLEGGSLTTLLPRSEQGVVLLAASPAGPLVGQAAVAHTLTALQEVTDLLVLDLGVADAAMTFPLPCDDLVLVAGYTVPALSRAVAAAHLLERVPEGQARRIWLVQRCPRGRGDLAEQVAVRLGLPLLGTLFDDPKVDAQLARGRPPGDRAGRYADAVEDVLAGLSRQDHAA